ncbi:uncharacterized protein LOC125718490 [Brienomyrus brachyistius]|uniref:uncharacterized protein LOC125718490 n=1 Tax=Brienomyrus brachyistius TaxID=42636 RepID=UPI0020B23BB4|nr:uncharacterized protein LOC125718490 [Brienomyrus brachyistius]
MYAREFEPGRSSACVFMKPTLMWADCLHTRRYSTSESGELHAGLEIKTHEMERSLEISQAGREHDSDVKDNRTCCMSMCFWASPCCIIECGAGSSTPPLAATGLSLPPACFTPAMDTVVLSSLLNGALLLVCVGLLLSFCVSCGQSWRQTSIHQFIQGDHQNEVYNPGNFRVVRPMTTVVPDRTPAPSSLRSSSQEPERRPSYTPTEDDDYVNQAKDKQGNGDDSDRQSYIEVIPGDTSSPAKNESQPSQCSGNDEIYVNVEQKSVSACPGMESGQAGNCSVEVCSLDRPEPASRCLNNGEYINMQDHENGGLTPGKSQESMESDENDSTDYVNTSPK